MFSLLQQRGLGRYYEIRSQLHAKSRAPGDVRDFLAEMSSDLGAYEYLDEPSFVALYSTLDPDGKRTMRFYLDGVHCAACVWLTEQVGNTLDGVESARLNLGDSVIRVVLSPTGKFAPVARELARFGYRPHPVRHDEADALGRQADRWLLARTGVAGACAGNIMLLAVSLYAGADGSVADTFRWTSLALSIPVLAFSAQPFYRGAWAAIRNRHVSIDLPIALGILLGAASSLYNLATGSPYLYFDSLSALVFLMLASRYLLIKTQRSAANSSKLIRFLTPAQARIRSAKGGRFTYVPIDEIRVGDEIEVFAGEGIPIDGVVEEGSSAIDVSLLTGESLPRSAGAGDAVYAGTVNQSAPLILRTTAAGSATRLSRTLTTLQEDLTKKAGIVTFADRVARIFVTSVLISVVVVFLVGLRQGLHEAVNLALALAIVTCPCAFALATPLAISLSLGRCAKAGVLIKSADALERLSQVHEVWFDKTGTLTEGQLRVAAWDPLLPIETDSELKAAILALESRSRHPVAVALVRHFAAQVSGDLPEIQGFKEVLGQGVSGVVHGTHYALLAWRGQPPEVAGHAAPSVGIWREGKLLGWIALSDPLRNDSRAVFERLKGLNLRLGILSGDSAPSVRRIAEGLGLPVWRWKAELGPEQKRSAILPHPRALMVGDGANDAPALAAAFVSVAVHGGVEVSLQSSDVYCRRPGIHAIAPLISVARETMKLIHRNFAFSLVYNAIGIFGVCRGWVTPLFAAILMPLSALTVYGSSMVGTRGLRRALREMSR